MPCGNWEFDASPAAADLSTIRSLNKSFVLMSLSPHKRTVFCGFESAIAPQPPPLCFFPAAGSEATTGETLKHTFYIFLICCFAIWFCEIYNLMPSGIWCYAIYNLMLRNLIPSGIWCLRQFVTLLRLLWLRVCYRTSATAPLFLPSRRVWSYDWGNLKHTLYIILFDAFGNWEFDASQFDAFGNS